MSQSNPLSDLLFGNTPRPRVPRRRRTNVNQSSSVKRIVVKHKGRLKHYRINKYGEVFEENEE